jgi:hypothetical protein
MLEALAEYKRLGIPPIMGGAPAPDEETEELEKQKAEADAKAKADEDELNSLGVGDKGKEAIKRERERRAAAEKDAKETKAKLAEFEATEAKRAEDARKAAEEDAVKKGEFEQLATKRGEELAAMKADLDSRTSTLAKYEEAISPLVVALEAEIPDEWKEGEYDEKAPAIDRLKWLSTRREKLIKTGVLAKDGNGERVRIPNTPKPNGKPGTATDEQRRAVAQQYRDF